MIVRLVTRHAGAIEWAARQGLKVDLQLAHLDPAAIQPGDVVIGILPVNLAAEVCARGGRYFNLSLDLPESARGRELSAADLDAFGARLEEFALQAINLKFPRTSLLHRRVSACRASQIRLLWPVFLPECVVTK